MRVSSPLCPGRVEGLQEGHKVAEGVGCHTVHVSKQHVCVQRGIVCVHTAWVCRECVCLHCVCALPGEHFVSEELAQAWI